MRVTKLGIGTPTAGLMEARTSYCLITAVLCTNGIQIQPLLGMGCYIHNNRNMIVDAALKTECSHLLQVDSDLMFPHDGITRLMGHNVDIVGARYNKRTLDNGKPMPTVVQGIKELSEVPFVPTGFLLVNCDVFKKIWRPWFDMGPGIESEDMDFCNKAIAAGYKVFCDPTIQIGHLGTAVF